jgi:3-oxo-4-pregnene-20-carboxyl-CoA dehydrogenase alpha subunit
MDLDLPGDAVEIGRVCLDAFTDAGGVDLARRAMVDPALRSSVVAPLLERLGINDLNAGSNDPDELLAVAEVCRAAGRTALPYPLGAAMLAPRAGVPVAVVSARSPKAEHGDLFDRWLTLDISSGAAHLARASTPPTGSRLGTFVTGLRLDTEAWVGRPRGLIARSLAFGSVTALGVAQQSLSLAVAHAQAREQFGQPIATFQSVQFALAHASTIAAGLEELARFTVIRLAGDDPAALVDALGLRLQTITVVRQVMRTAHQLHGAVGFCTEHDLTILTRALQPLTRLPVDLSGTSGALVAAVDRYGFDGLFPVPAA